MTRTWTDTDLDAALHELAGALDDHAEHAGPGTTASLAAVRDRLTGDRATAPTVPTNPTDPTGARAPVDAEVLVIGAAPGRGGRHRVGPVLLVAAALVVAVTLAAVLWPHHADRSAPPAGPGPSSAADIVAARQALLPEPLPDTATSLLLSIAGVGDATVAIPPIGTSGPASTIAYGFVCGDPRFGGDPNGPDNDVSEYTLTDNQRNVDGGSCNPIGSGVAVAGFGVGHDHDPRGPATIRVDVPSEDTVWKLTVAATTR